MLNNAREIVNELREFKTSYESLGVKFAYTPSVCEKAANLIEALLDERWNRATETVLPGTEVLAVNRFGEMMVGWVSCNGDEYMCESDNEILTSVTHWMPKPALPEELR